ncbi:putative AC transposase [Lolium perenne]|uniref:putative AC transposase n=1 Tax=Lolium perenne TaxID=4522 RepID=UPI0021F5C50A|nr:uncharacterized protein LOC127292756 isoform X7 [Lolium perenne]
MGSNDGAHAESINLQFENPLDEDTARQILRAAPGVTIKDDRASNRLPTPLEIGEEVPAAGDVLGDPQLQVGGEPKISSEIHGKLPKKIRKKAHIKLKVARCRNELQQYVEEGFHPCTPDFNILKWWDVNSERYPILGNMARDVLAVPASTVASESAFSACGRVITDHRSSLAPETVEALMCYGDWIRSRKPTNAGQENRCEEQRVVDHLVCGT